jgi:hypothetical protein
VQRRLVALLFLAIGICLAALAVYAATSGGRAWIIAVAAAGLAVWMGDLARKAWPKAGRVGKKV